MRLLELDYYTDRAADGTRSNVRTVRIEVPDGTDDIRLPFILTSKIGKHEGIRRVKIIEPNVKP